MFLQIGDIIIVRGTVFKENGLYDPRIYGHPALVLDATDEMFYYLIISSKKNNIGDSRQYYYFKNKISYSETKHNGFINCKNIYKRATAFHTVRDNFSDELLNNVLNRFIYYQEYVFQDEFYNQIKENVKRYRS